MRLKSSIGKFDIQVDVEVSAQLLEAAARSEIASRIAGAVCGRDKAANLTAVSDREALSQDGWDARFRHFAASKPEVDGIPIPEFKLVAIAPKAPSVSGEKAKAALAAKDAAIAAREAELVKLYVSLGKTEEEAKAAVAALGKA